MFGDWKSSWSVSVFPIDLERIDLDYEFPIDLEPGEIGM